MERPLFRVWWRLRQAGSVLVAFLLVAVIGLVPVAHAAPGPTLTAGGNASISSQTCRLCHTQGPGPTVNFSQLSHSVHAHIACTSCHRGVAKIPHAKTLAPVDCGSCHAAIAAKYRSGIHGHLHLMGLKAAPTCVTCHGTHGITAVNTLAFWRAMPRRCATCHRQAYWSYRDTFHGQAGDLGMRNVATCWSCHRPHEVLPPTNPASRVASVNLTKTCGQCHSGVNTNFVQFQVHPDPSSPSKSLAIYWAHMFMVGLLIFVFGFFGIHTLLWFQRSAVALIRHEVPRHRSDTQYIIRFNRVARFTHITIVVSFMLLALTGLPLLYHYAPWAHPISELFGGEGVARIIHRVCGGITFGYAFFHLGYLTYLIVRKRKYGVIYGVDSMTPNPKDARDLWRNIRWFFYTGPRPQLERWTYWEKFDYWAVFWGVAIIGLSGLSVWLFSLFTKVLSGVYLNVAWVIHGEEALLAVGFIFVFHFFHNHLRPENFPIDVTIFTGRLPLNRFREERPILYERLAREGKLDHLLVAPPGKLTQLAWQLFGYCVVFVGLALIISVILAMVQGH